MGADDADNGVEAEGLELPDTGFHRFEVAVGTHYDGDRRGLFGGHLFSPKLLQKPMQSLD